MERTHLFTRAHAALLVAAALAIAGMSLGCGKSHDECATSPAAPCRVPPPAPLTVKSVLPNAGPTGGAAIVRIAGTGFQPGATVTLDNAATNVTVLSSTLILATVPTHPAGPVDVVVTNSGGESSRLPGAFTFVPMEVTAISPTTGLTDDVVSIAGTGFLPGATVTLDGVAATVTLVTSTRIDVTTPAHAPGTVDVVVTNPGGQSGKLSDGYTYGAVSLTPSSSPVASGGQLDLRWVAPSGRPFDDWVALFKVGEPNTAYGWWAYTRGVTSGTLTLTAPTEPGQYEFRYLVNDGFIDVGRSSPVIVSVADPASPSIPAARARER
jgi:hypothetical protein